MPNYTLVLDQETADRVIQLTKIFGGSVGGFGSSIVRDLARLTTAEIIAVRSQISTLAATSEKERKLIAAIKPPEK
jgi:hypothetical protein